MARCIGEKYHMQFSVLIADDSKMSRNKVKKILSSFLSEMEATEAANGQEVIDICGTRTFDLMLLDLNMPEVDGYQVLRTLKSKNISIPIIVVTANYQRGSIAEVEEIGGAIAFLRKPLTQEILEPALRENKFIS